MALWAQFKAEMPRRWKNDSPLRFPYDKGIVFQKSFLLGRSVDLYPKIACKGTDNFSRCKGGVGFLFELTLESKSKDQRAKFKWWYFFFELWALVFELSILHGVIAAGDTIFEHWSLLFEIYSSFTSNDPCFWNPSPYFTPILCPISMALAWIKSKKSGLEI